jgi:hypothetical protein
MLKSNGLTGQFSLLGYAFVARFIWFSLRDSDALYLKKHRHVNFSLHASKPHSAGHPNL